jgi:DNA-directed RNA polymerase subunit alpha
MGKLKTSGGASSLLAEPVNVREVLSASTFGADEVAMLTAALGRHQYGEVRQELQPVIDAVEDGDRNKTRQLQAGIGAYLLAQHVIAERILAKLPGDPLAEFHHGHTLVALGRYTEAAAAYQSAGKHGYDPVDSMLSQAGALRAGGDAAAAESIIKQAASQGAARKADYSFQMGCLLADRGDTYGAVEYFERAVDMDSHHSQALFWLAGLNALRGNDDDAIRLYEQSLCRPPLYLNALINLGLLYEDNENYKAAAFCFQRVLEVDPMHHRALLYLRDIDAVQDMYYDEDTLKNQARMRQILEIPVTDFELSVRARNCLQKMGVRNLGDLTRLTEQDLLSGKNFGETSLTEIKQMLEMKGLRLGQQLAKDRPRDFGYTESLSPQQQALLSKTVADLSLSVRARKCMSRLGIATLGELILRTPDELLESKNFGVTSLNEVRQKLSELNLKLRND